MTTLRPFLTTVGAAFGCVAVSAHAQLIVQRPDIQQLGLGGPPPLIAPQSPTLSGAQFDVVSIKPNTSDTRAGGGRELPDGTRMFTNRTIATIVAGAASQPVFEVIGLPDWAKTEHYDIIAKPPPDSHPTREQRAEMMRNLFVERFRLIAHVEERERHGFALVIARSDGRLGPQLSKSKLDCAGADGPQCGVRMGAGTIEYKGERIDGLARAIDGVAGGPVTNRTGLDGFYDLTLRYSARGLNADVATPPDDTPSIFTALQEQLGLKLVPEQTKVKIFVIDHIERPTPNQ
jgi:uncharacterized protein (TIGR03435 family)